MKINSFGIMVSVVVACVISAGGATVSKEQAAIAARTWVRSGARMGTAFGQDVEKTSAVKTASGHSFYAVKFAGGGTVFTSTDTMSEPIVAFTSSQEDFSSISTNSPLYRLLARDAEVRANIREFRAKKVDRSALGRSSRNTVSQVADPSCQASAKQISERNNRWASLLSNPAGVSASYDRVLADSGIDDIRVAPLLKTKWSQTTHNDYSSGHKCYNYYTPKSAPCGCTATAMSQIMKYFEYPKESVDSKGFQCSVNNVSQELKTIGGVFKWDAMVNMPKVEGGEAAYEAIGHLTYDVGVALLSSYSASATSALPYDVPGAFDHFKYSNSRCFWYFDELANESSNSEDGTVESNQGLHNAANRRNVIYTNLDNHRPVLLAIYGYDVMDNWVGHAVVGDGYGMVSMDEGSVEYVHINMGWSGSDDAWYNIPEINAMETGATGDADGTLFTVMAGAIYNIFENGEGEIVSGRVLGEDGKPAAKATVFCGDVSAETDDSGIYSLVLPSRSICKIEAVSKDSRYTGSTSVNVGASSTSAGGSVSTTVGNRWGVDINLEYSATADSVRIPRTGELYSSLDQALGIAVSGDEIEVLKPTVLRRSVEITRDVAITATNAIAAKAPVSIKEGVSISVSGCRLNLDNIVFAGEQYSVYTNLSSSSNLDFSNYTNLIVTAQVEPFSVAAGASIAVSGDVSVPELILADDNGFVLAGRITNEIKVLSPSLERGAKIGIVECAESIADECVGLIVHPSDAYLCAGVSPYPDLRWVLKPVEDEDLVATLEFEGDSQVYRYSNLERLFLDVTNDASIVLKRDCSLRRPVVIDGRSISLCGGDGYSGNIAVSDIDPGAGFILKDNASLSISGIDFSGYTGNGLFIVDGEGAELELNKNVNISDVNGTNRWSGAISVLKGTVTINGTCSIRNCNAIGGGTSPGSGGAVYLEGEGCTLNLHSRAGRINIAACSAGGFGGGIYAGRKSIVKVLGPVTVFDCVSQNGKRELDGRDNIYLDSNNSTSAVLKVVGKLYSEDMLEIARLGVRHFLKSGKFGNSSGMTLAVNEWDVDEFDESELENLDDIALNNAGAFISDSSDSLEAEVSGDFSEYVWKSVDSLANTEQEFGDVARIIRDGGVTTNYYKSISEAMKDLGSGFEVMEIIDDCYFDGNFEISGNLLIRTIANGSAESQKMLMRSAVNAGFTVVAGGSLTLEDVWIVGMYWDPFIFDFAEVFGVCPLFAVDGGELTLGKGAVIGYSTGSALKGNRAAGCVTVWNRGVFTMLPGSSLEESWNEYVNEGNASSVGGGVLLDNSTGIFTGGAVVNCMAYRAAGVFVGNSALARVSGDFAATNNITLAGESSDLVVENSGRLELDGVFTGKVGVDWGIKANTNLFGSVSGVFAGEEELSGSAANFVCNKTGAFGVAATNLTTGVTNLLWSTTIDAFGGYIDDDGNKYSIVGEIPETSGGEPGEEEFATPLPVVFTYVGMEDDGFWTIRFTNAVQWCHYSLYSTNSLSGGFAIDGVEPVTNFQWQSTGTVVEIKLDADGAARFWKATAEKGREENN